MRCWEKIVLIAWVTGCTYSVLPYALGRIAEAYLVGFSFTIGSLLVFFSGYLLEGHEPIQRIRSVTVRLRREVSRSHTHRLGIVLFLGGVTGLVMLFIIYYASWGYSDMPFRLALWSYSGYLVSVSEMFVYLGIVLIMLWGYMATRQRGLLFMVPFFWFALSRPMLEALGGLPSYGIDRISQWTSWQFIYSGSLSMMGGLTMILFFFGVVQLVMNLRILRNGRGQIAEKAVKDKRPMRPMRAVLPAVIILLVFSSVLAFSWRAGWMLNPSLIMSTWYYGYEKACNIGSRLENMDNRGLGTGASWGGRETCTDWYVKFEPHRDGVRVKVYTKKIWIWTKKTVIVPLRHISLDEEIKTPIVRKGTSYEFELSTDTKSWIEKVGNKFTVYFHREPVLGGSL